jgi:cytochrome c556
VARGGKTSGGGRAKRARRGESPKSPAPNAPGASTARADGRRRRATAKAPAEGASPVDIIIGMMRGDLPFDDARFKAAVAAAPYVHARRGTAEPTEGSGVRHEDALKDLE